MNEIKVFTDGSVNPQCKIGYGAYLLIDTPEHSLQSLEKSIKTKRFEQTSSTKLELQTLLWALTEVSTVNSKIIFYTDCQNILSLQDRRKRFEGSQYMTKKNKLITNHELYKEFYRLTDLLECSFVKVKGHKLVHEKDNIDKIFTLVDKASRKALREDS